MNMEKADFSARMANHRVGRLVYLLKLLGIAALYALLAKIVLTFFSANGVVSIVWPPSGLALSVLLMGGKRYFPGVFLGAFLANAMTGLALGVAAAIAIGNTLEALLGAWILTRDGRFDSNLRTLRDYMRLVVLAGFVACSVAALNGSTTLLVSGFITSGAYFQNLLNWWMGDALGIMLVTPLILVWRRMPNGWLEPKRMTEAVLVIGLTLLGGQIIFLSWFHYAVGQVAQGYWMFLFVTWAAARLGIHGVVTILFMTAIQGLLGAVQGVGFFAHDIAKTGLVNYWFYIMTLSVVGMALSIHFTERKQIEEALRKSETRFRNILEHAPIGMAVASLDGRLTQVNQSLCIILGYEKAELEKLTIREITHPEYVASSFANIKRLLDGELDHYRSEKRYIRKDGRPVWAQLAASIERDGSGAPWCFIGQIEDITERKQAEEKLRASEQKFMRLFMEIPIPLGVADKEGVIAHFNNKFTEVFGYTTDDVPTLNEWWLHAYPNETYRRWVLDNWNDAVAKATKEGTNVESAEYNVTCKNGAERIVIIGGSPVEGGVLAIFNDITERKQAEEQIRTLAFYDALTQLPNRRLLNDRLGQTMAASKRSGHYGALMFLDMDNFKPLNDAYGHGVGDLLLIEVAHRLTGCVREVDTIARFGGDEFVVMLSDLDEDKAESTAQAGIVAEKIRAALAEPYLLTFRHEGEAETTIGHHCTSSIGVVLFINHEASQEDLLKWADMAMYQAKNSGRNRICIYE